MRRAFSLTELLVVIAIIAVVAALLFPVFAGVKTRAKAESSKEKLRQLFLATSLYRGDQNGEGKYGDLSEMGLPHFDELIHPLRTFRPTPPLPQFRAFSKLEAWKSPCGPNPMWKSAADYFYRPAIGGPEFAEEARRVKERLVLFADPTCGSRDVPLEAPAFPHRILAIRLSGEIYDRSKPGKPLTDASYWYDEHDKP